MTISIQDERGDMALVSSAGGWYAWVDKGDDPVCLQSARVS